MDVRSVLIDRIEAAGLSASEKGIDVRLEDMTQSTPTLVPASSGALDRIVDELIGNAIAYARREVIVNLASDQSWVSVVVDDDGPGVPEDERESIFQRFVRGSTSVAGGSGLGLALVSESAQTLGGSATASESSSGGLRVEVRIPRVVD